MQGRRGGLRRCRRDLQGPARGGLQNSGRRRDRTGPRLPGGERGGVHHRDHRGVRGPRDRGHQRRRVRGRLRPRLRGNEEAQRAVRQPLRLRGVAHVRHGQGLLRAEIAEKDGRRMQQPRRHLQRGPLLPAARRFEVLRAQEEYRAALRHRQSVPRVAPMHQHVPREGRDRRAMRYERPVHDGLLQRREEVRSEAVSERDRQLQGLHALA